MLLQFDPQPFPLTLFFLGALCWVCALVASGLQRKIHVSETVLALVVGIVLGPHCLGTMQTTAWGWDPISMIGHLSTLLLSLQLMSLSQSLTRTRPSLGDFLPLLVLLLPGFILSGVLTSLACFLLLDLSVVEAMCFGVCLAPLDPVHVAATLRGRFVQSHLPPRLTWLLGAEAAMEHAIALPTLAIPTLLLLHPGKEGWAMSRWALEAVVYDTFGALLIGMMVGWAMGRFLPFLRSHELLEPTLTSTDTLTSLLACILCGGSEMIGLNGLAVVCASGVGIGLGDREPPDSSCLSLATPASESAKRRFGAQNTPVLQGGPVDLMGSSLPSLLLFRENYCPSRLEKPDRRKSRLWTLETGQQEGVWEDGGRGPWRRWSEVGGRGASHASAQQKKALVPIVRVDTSSLSASSSSFSSSSSSLSSFKPKGTSQR
ncbi:Sodium/hydrogen exchanger family-domain-containing protein [Piptocephalis cylindrospora]|uniref:Sodium/hydrogen exchanger family-domain-containing protein n=1 Tax=Piptocephalis cylindrospora TaxID=1907219 RepID=A0A4P9Y8P5_9FUNG|nr:Sodium/hydrogen exchanger family-domain-containing protein [Piptocephalis cylindrospora]|eukprot:RKP14731.1 Sodium/hydrogen exchanger family-domain-containing protein [Piptocephalis cylindrospora]